MIRKGYNSDLDFTTYIICNIAEMTYNKCSDVTNKLGEKGIEYLYNNAPILHCDNPRKIMQEIIDEYKIKRGTLGRTREYPTGDELATIFHNLIIDLFNENYCKNIISLILNVFDSKIGKALEQPKYCLYWQSPECIYDCFIRDSLDFD